MLSLRLAVVLGLDTERAYDHHRTWYRSLYMSPVNGTNTQLMALQS